MKGLSRVCYYSIVALMVMLCLPGPSSAQVEEMIDTREKRDVVLYRGDIVGLKVYSLTRIAISTPGVVDIVKADVDEILLSGKALGQTQIFLWDEYGKRSVLARVMEQDLDMMRERIEQLLDAAEIKGVTLQHSTYEGKLIATGKVNKVQKDEFDKVVENFGDFIINMVEAQGDLIQIDAQVTQLNTTLQKVLGVEWDASFSMDEVSYPTNTNGFLGDIFKIGDLERTELINATVNALLTTSEARTLSRPSVVVSDGEEANILVGGEVPIVSTTTSDGAISENVTYKNYGVELSVTPEIKDDDKIDVQIDVSVRDLGGTYGDNTSFTTTSAQTRVLLDDGQTVIIAGLIKQGESTTETKVPFLHKIPIIGWAFRNKSYLKSPDQELVISLTPHLRRQKNKLKTNQEMLEEEAIQQKAAQEKTVRIHLDDDGLKIDSDDDLTTAAKSLTLPDDVAALLDDDIEDVMSAVEQTVEDPATVPSSDSIKAYAKGVQQKIADRISFPFQAKEEGWDGVVTLTLTILKDGTLEDVQLKESSGHEIFDQDALNTARIVSPFEPFPESLTKEQIVVTVPVVYSQDSF